MFNIIKKNKMFNNEIVSNPSFMLEAQRFNNVW